MFPFRSPWEATAVNMNSENSVFQSHMELHLRPCEVTLFWLHSRAWTVFVFSLSLSLFFCTRFQSVYRVTLTGPCLRIASTGPPRRILISSFCTGTGSLSTHHLVVQNRDDPAVVSFPFAHPPCPLSSSVLPRAREGWKVTDRVHCLQCGQRGPCRRRFRMPSL